MKCLTCSKTIEWMENIGYENDACVINVLPGYGSRYDLSNFKSVICDDCIEKAVEDERIITETEYNEQDPRD